MLTWRPCTLPYFFKLAMSSRIYFSASSFVLKYRLDCFPVMVMRGGSTTRHGAVGRLGAYFGVS